jgi:hypothetical protein
MVSAWSVDRLGHSLTVLLELRTKLHAKKVDLYLHQQGLDTSTPSVRAMLQMMGVFAEFERAMIRERVLAGLARARQAGTHLGRKFTEDTRGRRGRRIVRSSRHRRHPGFLGVSRNFRHRHDCFSRGARSRSPARTHATGRQQAAARAAGLLAGSVRALDSCRARSWPFPLERRRAPLATRRLLVHGRGRLRPGTMVHAGEQVFLLSHSHPDRPHPACYSAARSRMLKLSMGAAAAARGSAGGENFDFGVTAARGSSNPHRQ